MEGRFARRRRRNSAAQVATPARHDANDSLIRVIARLTHIAKQNIAREDYYYQTPGTLVIHEVECKKKKKTLNGIRVIGPILAPRGNKGVSFSYLEMEGLGLTQRADERTDRRAGGR